MASIERLRRRQPLAVAALAVIALAGCGGSEPPAARDSQQVAAVVEEFNRAALGHDFAEICDRLLTSAARAAAGGSGCPARLASGAGSLDGAKLRLTTILLRGDQATATINATRPGSAASTETLELVRVGHTFRISSAVSAAD